MSLKSKILDYFNNANSSVQLADLYESFSEHKPTTVRARVYEQLGDGIIRVDKGLYISSNAIIQHGDSLKIIDNLIHAKEKYDLIFLDIPYLAKGQRSGPNGNRNLFPLDMISVEDFQSFIKKCELLLSNEHSPILFMFTSGKSSSQELRSYLECFKQTSLKQCDTTGSYTKLWSNGKRMNMGKYPMPIENIYIFNRSGTFDLKNVELHFRLVPDLSYPTSKPLPMIKSLIENFTKPLQWVLDPFAGSGKVLQSCLELGRRCHSIDISEQSIAIQKNHLLYQQLSLF